MRPWADANDAVEAVVLLPPKLDDVGTTGVDRASAAPRRRILSSSSKAALSDLLADASVLPLLRR